MIDPSEEDVGREVVYVPRRGSGPEEYGVIHSVTAETVFVRYGANPKPQATSRSLLKWGGGRAR